MPRLYDDLVLEFLLSQWHKCILNKEVKKSSHWRLKFFIDIFNISAVVELHNLFISFLFHLYRFFVLFTDLESQLLIQILFLNLVLLWLLLLLLFFFWLCIELLFKFCYLFWVKVLKFLLPLFISLLFFFILILLFFVLFFLFSFFFF